MVVYCRYFEESPEEEKFCPFGHDCLYKHENADGTPHVFPRGVDFYMTVSQSPSLVLTR